MMDGLERVDENSAEGKEYVAILQSLDSRCQYRDACDPGSRCGGASRREIVRTSGSRY